MWVRKFVEYIFLNFRREIIIFFCGWMEDGIGGDFKVGLRVGLGLGLIFVFMR